MDNAYFVEYWDDSDKNGVYYNHDKAIIDVLKEYVDNGLPCMRDCILEDKISFKKIDKETLEEILHSTIDVVIDELKTLIESNYIESYVDIYKVEVKG